MFIESDIQYYSEKGLRILAYRSMSMLKNQGIRNDADVFTLNSTQRMMPRMPGDPDFQNDYGKGLEILAFKMMLRNPK
jgi:hypothetical protein